jgi:hypothetical protein
MRRRMTRGMRRPLTWLIAGGLLALGVAAGVDALRGRSSAAEPVLRNPFLAPSTPPASADVEGWARDVAVAAGYQVVGNTGTAWVMRRRGESWHENFYFWVTRTEPRAASATAGPASDLGSEGFPLTDRIGSVPVFGDGVRFAWRLSRGTAWAEAAGDRPLTLPQLNRLVLTSSTVPVQAAPPPDRLPTCTSPQLDLVIEVPGGSAAVALRHVTGSPCHLGRLPVKMTVRDREGNVVPLVGGEGLGVSAFRGDFSPGFEQLRNVTFLPACTPETIPHASYVLSARAGSYRARKRLSGVEIGCFGGG